MSRSRHSIPTASGFLLLALMTALPASGRMRAADEIPRHPSELEFAELEFAPPDRLEHRHELSNGVVVYVIEDRSLPLVDVEVLLRLGAYLEPQGLEGLSSAFGSQLRSGGTASLDPETFDEEVDFLAARIGVSTGGTQSSASFNCLTKDLDRVLDIFFEMLRSPRFDAKRLEVWRGRVLQSIARRNDSTSSIEGREWARLLWGPKSFRGDHSTKASIEAIDSAALKAFHARYVHPRNCIVAVSGDVDTQAILAELEKRFEGWTSPTKEEEGPNVVPAPGAPAEPGVYFVDKDVNQGRVTFGHRGLRRGHADQFAVQILNHVLGGGGFTSRIMSRVRSDEGLAYSARSAYSFGVWHDGSFTATFQSKSPSVAQAAAIVLEEIERVRREKVSKEELDRAISYYVNVFPGYFSNASTVASTFAADELTGRDPSYWTTFREKVSEVTADAVLEAAKEHLHPKQLMLLIVGNTADIRKGNPDKAEFSIDKILESQSWKAHVVPLPDPETLEYPEG